MKKKKVGSKGQENFANQYNNLFHCLAEPIVITDLNGTVLTINKPIPEIDINGLAGKNIFKLFGDTENNFINIINSVLENVVSQIFEYTNPKSKKHFTVEVGPIGDLNDVSALFFILKENSTQKTSDDSTTFSRDFYTKLFSIAQIIVVVLDKNGNIITMNPYLEKLLGYQTKEIQGKNWFSTFLLPEDQDRIMKVFKSCVNNVSNKEIVNCIITKTGQQRLIEWYDSALKDANGKTTAILAIGHDITDRVEAENALITSKTQLVTALKIAKIGYWEFDFINNQFIFNDHFYSVLHTTAERIGGYAMSVEQYIDLFVHPDDKQFITDFIRNGAEKFKSANDQYVEHKVVFGDGKVGYLSIRIIITHDEKGNIKMLGANQDITERIVFEETIRKSEAQLSNAMKMARLGCWEYDVATNLFTFNDNFYSIFGATADDVGGYTMTPEQYANKFMHPDDRQKVFEETQKALDTDDPSFSRQLEHRIIYADGEIGYISVRIFIVKDKEGRTIKTFGANQDITEQKRIEKILEDQNKSYLSLNQKLEESLEVVKKMNTELELAKNKAEENDKLKSAFLANLSHEIRTPMNGIMGFSKMLNKKGLSDERRQQYTDIIDDMSHQLLHLIDEIINISKIETGQLDIWKTQTNINDIFIKLFSYHKPIAEKNNINLYIQKGLSDNHSEILTDGSKLRQILDNLIRNAIKFTNKGFVKFGYQLRNDGLIEFYVEDSGIGIPIDIQSKIFERFRQGDNGAAKLYGGAGLGLSISKAFVEKLGGSIWLHSEQDKGSTFYFTIPYVPANDSGAEYLEQNKNEKYSNQPVILIVEDEEINYLYLEEVLLESNVKILHAKRGNEAVEIFTNNPLINIVLLDIKLPDINGIEVMKKMKRMRPSIPVIAQTAYALAGDMERALELGFDNYISKPIDDKELLNKINFYLNSKQTT